MTSTPTKNTLPAELVLDIWRLHAASKHDELCPRGARCPAPELCAEAQSPDPAVALVSEHWRQLAALNPQMFSFIRVEVNFDYWTNLNVNSIAIPIDNEHDVKAYTTLSGSEYIHLSIGCSTSEAEHDIAHAVELTLGDLAARVRSLVLDADNPELAFMVASTSFPRLEYVHLDHGWWDYGHDHNSDLIEDFLLWRDSPIERVVCGHKSGAVLRTKISWSAITLLDLHGVHIGFREADVEAILSLGVSLEELRVAINEISLNPGIPPMPRNVTGNGLEVLAHHRLKTLFLKYRAWGSTTNRPPHQLFKGMEFKVLENLHYSCTGYPHDNSIQWLKESRPTVKVLSIDAHYISSGALHSILPAFSRLQSLHLEAQGTSGSDQDCLSFDDPTLDALRGASVELVTLFLCGEGSFTTDAMARFVEARRGSLQTFLLQEWCGPTSKQVDAVKGALSPVDLKVGRAYACETTRLRGTRAERETVVDRCDGDGKGAAPDEEFPRDGPLAYWCIPCGKNHYVEVVDAEALDMWWPMINDRKREFIPWQCTRGFV